MAGRTWCLSSVSAVEETFLQFLPQKELFSSFYRKMNFSPVSATGLTFLLCSKTFCCAIKLPAMQQNFLLCNQASCYVVKLSAVKPSAVQ